MAELYARKEKVSFSSRAYFVRFSASCNRGAGRRRRRLLSTRERLFVPAYIVMFGAPEEARTSKGLEKVREKSASQCWTKQLPLF